MKLDKHLFFDNETDYSQIPEHYIDFFKKELPQIFCLSKSHDLADILLSFLQKSRAMLKKIFTQIDFVLKHKKNIPNELSFLKGISTQFFTLIKHYNRGHPIIIWDNLREKHYLSDSHILSQNCNLIETIYLMLGCFSKLKKSSFLELDTKQPINDQLNKSIISITFLMGALLPEFTKIFRIAINSISSQMDAAIYTRKAFRNNRHYKFAEEVIHCVELQYLTLFSSSNFQNMDYIFLNKITPFLPNGNFSRDLSYIVNGDSMVELESLPYQFKSTKILMLKQKIMELFKKHHIQSKKEFEEDLNLLLINCKTKI